jgi:hypothetical protein
LHGELFHRSPRTTGFLKGFSAGLASTDRWRIPAEEFAPPGHFLVGEELDLEIAATGLLPSDFLDATLPLPTTAGGATPTSSDIPPRMHKRPRQWTPTEPRADLEANRTRCPSQPRPEPPVTMPVPPTRSSFVAAQDPSQPVHSFLLEGFCLLGAVICTLFPPCRRCNNSVCLCVLEIVRGLPGKTPQCCSPCKSAHTMCSTLTKFSSAYENGNDMVLRGFRVAFWEHLGSGSFQPLHPDPRAVDLTQTCA